MRTALLSTLLCANASFAATHCTPAESVAFSCSVGASKTVSLCVSTSPGRGPAQVAYRFGRPGTPEFVFPTTAVGSTERFLYAHYFRYQVDRTEVSFSNAGAQFSVFDYYDGEERPRYSRGVRVTVDGKDRELMCRGDVVAHLSQLESLVPCDAENALASCR